LDGAKPQLARYADRAIERRQALIPPALASSTAVVMRLANVDSPQRPTVTSLHMIRLVHIAELPKGRA
jgi:hypothetical protein